MVDLHDIWPHRWINPKAKSFNSKIAGLGVKTLDNISKGDIVLVYGGVIVPKEQILKYRKYLGHVGIQVDDNFFICPTTREELERTGIINHSCDPNLGFKDSIMLSAIKDIKKEEELTFDYAFSESFFETFKCNCDSKDCRREIRPTDWQIKKLQDKYREYFSPYIKKKFK